MTAAEDEWQPGDPLLPDNGCGRMPTVSMSPQEAAEACDEDPQPPPWWRPGAGEPGRGYTRVCQDCDVRWRGDAPCWSCGAEVNP